MSSLAFFNGCEWCSLLKANTGQEGEGEGEGVPPGYLGNQIFRSVLRGTRPLLEWCFSLLLTIHFKSWVDRGTPPKCRRLGYKQPLVFLSISSEVSSLKLLFFGRLWRVSGNACSFALSACSRAKRRSSEGWVRNAFWRPVCLLSLSFVLSCGQQLEMSVAPQLDLNGHCWLITE